MNSKWLIAAALLAVAAGTLVGGCTTDTDAPPSVKPGSGGAAGEVGGVGGNSGSGGRGGSGGSGASVGDAGADVPVSGEAGGTCRMGANKPLGAACGCSGECSLGFCVDGVCCNTACSGGCVTCNDPGNMGECTAVAAGAKDPHDKCKMEGPESCGTDGTCNGLGGCSKYPPGTMCKAAACAGGGLVPASSCDGNGTCLLGTQINCAPSLCVGNACKLDCASDNDCAAPNRCQNGSCGLRGLGQVCTDAKQCKSGFCADGYCCENACGGKCMNCGLPSALGRCLAVGANAPDPRVVAKVTDPALICVDQGPNSCGTNGKCDGMGACQRYPNGTTCRAQSCDATANRFTAKGVCQSNACEVPAARACSPYKCDGTRCGASCTGNGDCAGGNVCINGSCGKKSLGSLCGKDGECQSNFCAQGVCCNTRCNGTCQACDLPGKGGTCTNVPDGGEDPTQTCKDQGRPSCGNDGTCNGSGGCRKYNNKTVCGAQKCDSGTTTAISLCDGKGKCVAGSKIDCSPYVCNDAGTNCFNSCTGTDVAPQCEAPNKCFGGKCGQLGKGQPCDETSDCKSPLACSDGVCCDKANCSGTCQSCKVNSAVGTCSKIGCTPGMNQSCGNNGTQTCNAQCSFGACGGQSCTGPATSSCENCGTKTRVCNTATGEYGPFGMCMNEGPCSPGSTGTCGSSGTRTCNDMCQWGSCGSQMCPGSPPSTPCEMCGKRFRTCNTATGEWTGDFGACTMQGVCVPGTTGMCGTGGTRTCQPDCQFGACGSQSCPGDPPSMNCGNCGKRFRTCNTDTGQWTGDFGACTMEGECAATTTMPCGIEGTRTCSSTCSWGACMGEKVVLGGSCTNGNQCVAGAAACVDGHCCAVASCGTCQACTGSGGTCAAVRNGPDNDTCPNENNACGKRGCDADGACKFESTTATCAGPTCNPDGTGFTISKCDGNGGCDPKPLTMCTGGLRCSGGACPSNCDSNGQCQDGLICKSPPNGTCGAPGGTGDACSRDAECTSNNCGSGGHCCVNACNGGTGACKATGCGNDGACTFPGSGTSCGADSCSGDSRVVHQCNGAGGCDDMTIPCGDGKTCQGAGECVDLPSDAGASSPR
jgi:hypothetical protein